jgi:hypothetical protein
MHERASSGFVDTVDGTTQPSLTSGLAGAAGFRGVTGAIGDLALCAIGFCEADGEPFFEGISAKSERVASDCSESVHAAIPHF